jgi:glycosyltransferase involved in cell wall biosynthesis
VRPIRLLVPGNIRHNSGGNVYNARLVRGLKTLGVEVEVLPVDGSWPESRARERRRLGNLLGAWAPEDAPGTTGTSTTETGTAETGTAATGEAGAPTAVASTSVTIVDGLIAMGAPDELEFAAKAGRETWILVHMPAPANYEREARSLRAASVVICTSSWAAGVLEARHGLRGLRVALPGTDPAPLAQGSVPPHIISVAALLPNKDQLLTLQALALIKDLEWTASLVGSNQADSEYAGLVRAAVTGHGLENRVRLTGELKGQALQDEWNRANLSVLVSRAEAFGMVITESLAHGIPAVVRAGTGAVEALSFAAPGEGPATPLPGAAVHFAGTDAPENPAVLAEVLRRWLLDDALRDHWRANALQARDRLPGWEQTAAQVLDTLGA